MNYSKGIPYIDRQTGTLQYETPPAVGLLKFLYNNPLGKMAVLPLAKRKWISEIYGRRMNLPGSKARIQPFVDALHINMDEAQKRIDEFETFNDFFYRTLKPGARPIGKGFVSPGDGKLLAFRHLNDLQRFFVKGQAFTLDAFLQNKNLAAAYEGGSLLILRLAPNDYHRFHFPYDGTPSNTTIINGDYFSVSPIALAQNFARVFLENKREYCSLKTTHKEHVLLAPVGATMVGSIVETYQPEQPVHKGDEMGYFAFGGSTVVVITKKNQLAIDADLLENTQKGLETFVRTGETIGH